MMRRWGLCLIVVALPLLAGWDLFSSADEQVRVGNERFERQDYSGAIEAYRVALGQGQDLSGIYFNIGTAQLAAALELRDGSQRDRLMGEAELNLRRGGDSKEPALRAMAYYNLGVLMYGRARNGDAIEAYRKALYANPGYGDARYNLELALRRRDEQQRQPGTSAAGGDQGVPTPGAGQPESSPEAPSSGNPVGDSAEQSRPEASGGANGKRGADGPEPRPESDVGERRSGQATPEGDAPGEASGDHPATAHDSPSAGGSQGAGAVPGKGDEVSRQRAPQPSFEHASDMDRKLDELERRSQALRLSRLRSAADKLIQEAGGKDW